MYKAAPVNSHQFHTKQNVIKERNKNVPQRCAKVNGTFHGLCVCVAGAVKLCRNKLPNEARHETHIIDVFVLCTDKRDASCTMNKEETFIFWSVLHHISSPSYNYPNLTPSRSLKTIAFVFSLYSNKEDTCLWPFRRFVSLCVMMCDGKMPAMLIH